MFIIYNMAILVSIIMVVVLMIAAIASCKLLLDKGEKLLALAREDQDALFNNFSTITAGIKELKLHYQRRQFFLSNRLEATASRFRNHNVQGLTLFATTTSWGKLIFFFAIGFVLLFYRIYSPLMPKLYLVIFSHLLI